MKIGILGGSFNPAHEGHLKISLVALNYLKLDKVYWLITEKNPLKSKSEYLPLDTRYSKAQDLIKNKNIKIINTEVETNSNYVIDNLRHLKKSNKDDFVFLMGSDSFINLDKWNRYESIVEEFPIVVFNRDNSEEQVINGFIGEKYAKFRLNLNLRELLYEKSPSWIFIKDFSENISSTNIRLK